MLGLTVLKIIEETNFDLDVAVACPVSAKNSLINVNDFSPNQFVFGKIPEFPNVPHDLLHDLENKTTSQTVAENLNALHSVKKLLLKVKHHSRALKHHTA